MILSTICAVGLHLASTHPGANDAMNNVNPGIYARDCDGNTLGAYRNSYNELTVYAAKDMRANFGRFHVGAVVGLGTGYKQATGYAISPVGALTAGVSVAGATVRVLVVPPVLPKSSAVFHVTLERPL